MRYEAVPDRLYAPDWRVEAIDHEGDGEVYVTLFSGPLAEARAKEYAAWKNGDRPDMQTFRHATPGPVVPFPKLTPPGD